MNLLLKEKMAMSLIIKSPCDHILYYYYVVPAILLAIFPWLIAGEMRMRIRFSN